MQSQVYFYEESSSVSQNTIGEKILSLFIIVLCSIVVAIPLGLLGGFKAPKFWIIKEINIKPYSKKLVVPPLVGMIIISMIARNLFGSQIKDGWPSSWAQQIKNVSLSLLLIRGGQAIVLKGQGKLTVLMSFLPQQFEAIAFALMAYWLLDMPILFCFCLAYIISCLSPSVMVPACINLLEAGYGKTSGLVSKVITGGTFDDLICITFFAIFQGEAYNSINMNQQQTSIGRIILDQILQLLIGIVFGLSMGFFSGAFIQIPQYTLRIYGKFIYCFGCAIMFVQVGDQIGYPNMKYIASLSFGYVSSQIWGAEKPTIHLSWLWFFIQPIFFACVGASLLFSQLVKSVILYGLICLFVAIIFRLTVALIITKFITKLTTKQALFMTICWVPKATVQAALGGIILTDGNKNKNDQVQDYGRTILAISVLSIIIFAPIGAILINTYGPVLLEKEQEQVKQDEEISLRTDSHKIGLLEQEQVKQDEEISLKDSKIGLLEK